ncbi:MAG TPA: hypothetical protein DCQ48_01170, partial [Erythrobacter sp.]|nr:hypothetical protein [Erythrobacter sp.]
MNSKLAGIILLTLGAASANAVAGEGEGHIERPYLGQEPPGSAPEPFAPGIITTKGWEYGGVFSPDMREFYVLKRDENET